jgi:exonuclease III
MKIVSWNCRCGFTAQKIEAMKSYQSDVLVIQEITQKQYEEVASWKHKDWYGDNVEASDQGIAIFSNTCQIERFENFDKNLRYVVPYYIIQGDKKLALFAVWTKEIPLLYDKNVFETLKSAEYKNILEGNSIIIGDFNTGSNTEDNEHKERYTNLLSKMKNFKNCALGTDEEYKETFYHDTMSKFFTNDFCFMSELFYKNRKIVINICNKWTDTSGGNKRWQGLSDHCPIIVDFDF